MGVTLRVTATLMCDNEWVEPDRGSYRRCCTEFCQVDLTRVIHDDYDEHIEEKATKLGWTLGEHTLCPRCAERGYGTRPED